MANMFGMAGASRKMCQWPTPLTSALPKHSAQSSKLLTFAVIENVEPCEVAPFPGETMLIVGGPANETGSGSGRYGPALGHVNRSN